MLLKWAGGKTWLVKNYADIFSEHDAALSKRINFNTYIEPFVGGGSVLRYLGPKESIIGDINNELITFYKNLRDNPRDLYEQTMFHMNQHSNDYYYETRDAVEKIDLNIAARFLYLNYTCFNGIYRVNQQKKFNVPIGDKKVLHYKIKDFLERSEIIKNTKILNQDFKKTIELAKKDDLIYVDPPYVNNSNKDTFNKYSSDIFTWKDQIELAKALNLKSNIGAKIIVSNIFDDEVLNLYDGWIKIPAKRGNRLKYHSRGTEYKEIIMKNF